MTRAYSLARASLLAALTLAGGVACAASAASHDLARVGELSRYDLASTRAAGPFASAPHPDVQRLLAEPLTAERAVQIALLGNRELQAQLREVGVARGRLLQAQLAPNPVVGVERPGEPEADWIVSLELDLTSTLLTPLRANAVEPELDAARHRAAATVVETGALVRKAYFEAQAAERQQQLSRQLVDAYAAGLDAAKAMVDSGNAATIELAARRASYEQARASLAQREQQAYTARENLQRLLGLFGTDITWKLDDTIVEVPEELALPHDLETRAIAASLELRRNRDELDSLARRTGVERTAGWLPDVSLDVHALRPSREAGSPKSDPAWLWGAGLNVGLPLFDRRQGNVLALESTFDAEAERYVGRAIELRSVVREVRFRLESAHARVDQFRNQLVPAQAQLVEQALLQVNAMQVSVFALIQARQAHMEAQLGEVVATRDYLVARAELDTLLAGGRVAASQTGDSTVASNIQTGGH